MECDILRAMQINRCPSCEFNRLPENDYLCEDCRVGESSEIQDNFKAFAEKHPEAADYIIRGVFEEIRLPRGNEFVLSLFGRITKGNDLTEKQLAAAEKAAEQHRKQEEEKADLTPIFQAEGYKEGERMEFTGEVMAVKEKYNDYGQVFKMLVMDDRKFKVWGSVPTSILPKTEKGVRVNFVASLSISKDDSTFGFYSRPAKAKVL